MTFHDAPRRTVPAGGRFAGRGPGGADVWLANVDAKDDVFDSVEVAEGKSQDLALASCDWQSTHGPSS